MVALAIAIVLAVTAGSGGGRPKFVPSGGGVGSASLLAPTTTQHVTPHPAPAFNPDPKVVALAGRLPLQRQVAQLFLVTLSGTTTGAIAALGTLDWGGVVLDSSNFRSDAQLGALAGGIAGAAHGAGLTAPLIAATQEGGAATAFADLPPEAQPALGASDRPALARAQALLAAGKLRARHFNMTLAPLADVDIPNGSLSARLFGGDPALVARFTTAAVDGYDNGGLISAVGHFPGAGAASADPDQMPATVGGSLAELRGRDLIPFAAIASSAPVIVMSNAAYAAFDGVTPAGLLAQAVTLLRADYGFAGVVMSDDLDATLEPTGSTPGSVALQALSAGDDLLYISGPPSERQAAYSAVLAAAQKSPAVRALVRTAALRVLSLKARYGLLAPAVG